MPIDRKSGTLTADGSSSPIRIDANSEEGGNAIVGYSISGTWSGVTATLEGCADPTASPNVYVPITNGAFTANVADSMAVPLGWNVRITVSGTGSPIPNLNYTLTREVKHGGSGE